MTHLQQHKNTFYFRIRIPVILQPYFNQCEIKKSLGQLSKYEASLVSERLTLKTQDTFNQIHSVIHSQSISEAFSDPQLSISLSHTDNTIDPYSSARDLVHHIKSLFNSVEVKTKESMNLTLMVDEYCNEKIREGSWTEKSQQENKAIYALFVRIVGNLDLENITHLTARQYKSTLQNLPPNLNKDPRYRDKSIEQVLSLKGINLMSVNTINKNIIRISSLFKWAELHGYITKNYFLGLTLRNSKLASEERSIFTNDDLSKIFNYSSSFKHNYQYWIPLLGLYTGCRLEELCQLHIDDVRQEDNIWVLDINEKGSKKLKTKSSKRLVPIHSKLIELGFIDYIDSVQELKEQRVFPELKKGRDGYSTQVSKWFSRYKKKLNLDDSKVFHSFRHTFANTLKQNNVEESITSALLGHSTDNITYSRYGKSYSSSYLYEVITLLNFDITASDSR